VAQSVGTGIALLFHDHGTRRGRVVSSTPRPLFTPGKDPVPIVQEAGWASGPVWTGAENLAPPTFDPRTVQPVVSRDENLNSQIIMVVQKRRSQFHLQTYYNHVTGSDVTALTKQGRFYSPKSTFRL